jgi:hypothetical protein
VESGKGKADITDIPARLVLMKRGRGIIDRDDKSIGIEIRMAEALAKINPTDPLILA